MSEDRITHAELLSIVEQHLGPFSALPDRVREALSRLLERLTDEVDRGLAPTAARAILLQIVKRAGREPDQIEVSAETLLPGSAAATAAFFEPADSDIAKSLSLESAPPPRQVKRSRPAAQPSPKKSSAPVGSHPRGPSPQTPRNRTVFPDVQCPDVVVAQQEFEVQIGLSPRQNEGVVGDGFTPPKDLGENFAVTIQVVATGFTVRAGESLRQVLPVSAATPYPSLSLHLVADAQAAPVSAKAIQAIYSVGAQTIGMAVRPVSVVRNASLIDGTSAPAPVERRDLAVPVGTNPIDMTVRLLRDNRTNGGLIWSIETRFADILVPAEPLTSDVGDRPEAFARRLMNGVNLRQAKPRELERFLQGIGKTVRANMPAGFWDILSQVAARAGRPPTLLLLTEEPYVPWELAFVEGPLIDPAAVPFLAAQAVVGRWPLRGPHLPPPQQIKVAKVSVVWGKYERPGWRRLEAAEQEADSLLHHRFGPAVATGVEASLDPILACLEDPTASDLLHFAVHGNSDATGIGDGIVMLDGESLDPVVVRSFDLTRRPFVFLNACQLGQSNQLLSDYTGMAESFLFAGASAVIAPLWSINDTLAKEAALAFYAGGADTHPAAALRQARLAQDGPGRSSTLAVGLAYQFFGHPGFLLQLPAPP